MSMRAEHSNLRDADVPHNGLFRNKAGYNDSPPTSILNVVHKIYFLA